jgi:hypothetical protein
VIANPIARSMGPVLWALSGVKKTSHTNQQTSPSNPTLPFLPGLEVLTRWIPTPSQGGIDTLQHEIMDFDPLIEGDLPQRLVDRLRQVQT